MTPKQIVKENFKGLNELIKDKELRRFYRDLIEICLIEYGKQSVINAIPENDLNIANYDFRLDDIVNRLYDLINIASTNENKVIYDVIGQLETIK